MKASFSRRSLKLLSLATQVGRKELAQNFKDQIFKKIEDVTSGRVKTRIEQAKVIVEHLSQLKGAAMKVGQLLSLDGADIFPPEAMELLSKLQSQIPETPWGVIEKVLNDELGGERIKDFTSLSQKAAASASIGQVHKGQLFGREVAVKVQYPGVLESVDSDLAILRTVANTFLKFSGKSMDLTEVFNEFALVLKKEADYIEESISMKEFGMLVKDSDGFRIPEPIPSHTTHKVLTMTWLPGLTVNDWLKTKPSQQSREHIARLTLDLYCKEFFEWGFVQTDPNFANFLVDPETLTLGLIDFGASLKYTAEFREGYVELLRAVDGQDRQRMLESFTRFGFLDLRESDEAKDLLIELLELALEPFRKKNQPFSFKDESFNLRTREIGQKLSQKIKFSTPPRSILFLHRKLGGVFALLKKLEVEIDLVPYWDRMLMVKKVKVS